jgi:hypothetical protein
MTFSIRTWVDEPLAAHGENETQMVSAAEAIIASRWVMYCGRVVETGDSR